MQELKNKFGDKGIAHENDINFDQFSVIDSPRSRDSSFFSANSSSSHSIRSLLSQDYNFYITKLKKNFPTFKFNHYSKYSEKIKSNLMSSGSGNTQIKCKEAKEDNITQIQYKPSMKLSHIFLPKEFLKEKGFTIEKATLEKKVDELEYIDKEYDRKVEIIEMEVEKILQHNSSLIYNYIEQNLSLENTVQDFITRLDKKRREKEAFKTRYMWNSMRTILLGSKKQNLMRVVTCMKMLRDMCGMIEELKVLGKDEGKCKEENELLSQAKYLLGKIKDLGSFQMTRILEKEMMNYGNRSGEKIIEEFAKIHVALFKSIIKFSADFPVEDGIQTQIQIQIQMSMLAEIYGLNPDKCKFVLNDHITHLLSCISFLYIPLIKDIPKPLTSLIEVFSIIIKENIDISLVIARLKKAYTDIITMLKEHIFTSLKYSIACAYSPTLNDEALIKKESDKICIAVLTKAFLSINQNYQSILELLANKFSSYPSQFKDLKKFIHNEIGKVVQEQIAYQLDQVVAKAELDKFIELKSVLLEICQKYFDEFGVSSQRVFSQYENDIVFQFFEIKGEQVRSAMENEEWTQLQSYPGKYQKMIGICCQNYIQIKREKPIEEILSGEYFNLEKDKAESSSVEQVQLQVQGNDSSPRKLIPTITSSSSTLDTFDHNTIASTLLDLKGKKFRVLNSSLVLINFIFDTYKLLVYLDISLHETVFIQFSKILISYLNIGKDIIEGEGQWLHGKKTITQKEISLLSSNVYIISFLISHILQFYEKENDDIIKDSLQKVLGIIEEIKCTCKDGMIQLIQSMSDKITNTNYSISSAIDELSIVDFAKYPVFQDKDHNHHIKQSVKFKKIYDSMLYSFDNEVISQVWNAMLPIYFDKVEKVVKSKCKIEADSMLRQFRNEMLYVKRILQKCELIDSEVYKDKIDYINKIVNPNKVLKKKKTDTFLLNNGNPNTEDKAD